MPVTASYRRPVALALLALACWVGPARAAGVAGRVEVPTPEHRTLNVAGVKREYLLRAPAGGNGPFPVVIVLHGGTQTADQIWHQVSLPAIGQREGLVVVAPQGLGKHWNDGRGVTLAPDDASTADDVGFLKALIDEVVAHEHGDASAVFLFGVSNGGFMTMRFACEAGERLRAAATGLATLPDTLAAPGACPSKAALPFLVEHGTDDPIVPFAGQAAGVKKWGRAQPGFRSSDETFRFWADRAGCAKEATRSTLASALPDDRHARWAEAVTRTGCSGGAISRQLVMHGSGHVFPGTDVKWRMVERVVGLDAPELDGGEQVWAHFKQTLGH